MWRNWQTRGVQVAVGLCPWRFESSHPHDETAARKAAFVVLGPGLRAAHRDGQRLGSDEALEAADERPDGARRAWWVRTAGWSSQSSRVGGMSDVAPTRRPHPYRTLGTGR